MSEVYKFKAMSQVETLEEPTGATTVLAVEDGAVKQIPAAKLGGSGGGYMVHGSIDTLDYSVSADKTFAEIVAAVESGCAPVLLLSMETNRLLSPLIMVSGELVLFQVNTGDALLGISCTSGNEWTLMMPE